MFTAVHARQPAQVRASHERQRTTLAEHELQPELQPAQGLRLVRPSSLQVIPVAGCRRASDNRIAEDHDLPNRLGVVSRQKTL